MSMISLIVHWYEQHQHELEKQLSDSYLVDSSGWWHWLFHFQVLHLDAALALDVFFSK